MSDLKKLTSHEFHLAKGAKFTAFAGWNMPVSYGSSLSEHLSVRESVGDSVDESVYGSVTVFVWLPVNGSVSGSIENKINEYEFGR